MPPDTGNSINFPMTLNECSLLILACSELLRSGNCPPHYESQVVNLKGYLIDASYASIKQQSRNLPPAQAPDAQLKGNPRNAP